MFNLEYYEKHVELNTICHLSVSVMMNGLYFVLLPSTFKHHLLLQPSYYSLKQGKTIRFQNFFRTDKRQVPLRHLYPF